MDVTVLSSQLLEADELITVGVVDGDLVLMGWTVDGEQIGKIDQVLPEVDLIINYD